MRTTVLRVRHHDGEPVQQSVRHRRLERRWTISVPGQLGVVSRLQRGRRLLHNFVAHQMLVVVFALSSQRLEKYGETGSTNGRPSYGTPNWTEPLFQIWLASGARSGVVVDAGCSGGA